MIFYSPYILDDIAGMTKNRENLARVDLAKVTGFVPSLSEKPGGPPAGYGQLVYLAIMKGAPPAAGDWCRYLVSDAYMRVLSMAKGGKVPARPEFLERWRQFEFFKLYDPAIPDQIIKGLGASGRWGFREGRAFTAIADVYGKHVFAEALDEMVSGDLSVDETMSRIAAKMEPIVKGLGE